MKSRTSFFNLTAFKKSLLRFAPLWALYTLFLLLMFFALNQNMAPITADAIADTMGVMCGVNVIYAGLCAMCLFGDLFSTRHCCALHAFPIRREGWLVTNLVAGVLFSLLPNILFCLLSWLAIWEYAYISLLWLAVVTLQYLFFFGTGVLAALCAGNRLGMGAIYGIIHLITFFLFGVAEVFYMPHLYGVALDEAVFERLFPLYQLSTSEYVSVKLILFSGLNADYFAYEGAIGEDWVYLGICAGVGILCMALSLLVYRCRQLERAGDFMSVKPLSPIFTVIISVACGMLLYLFGTLLEISAEYAFLVAGIVIGYLAAQMLLKRTLRVFSLKSILACVALVALLFGSIGVAMLDPLNIAGWVPKPDEVDSVAVYTDTNNKYMLTEEEDILNAIGLHGELLQSEPKENAYRTLRVNVSYVLKSGRTVTRYYWVIGESALGQKVKPFLSDARYIFGTDDIENLYTLVNAVTVDNTKSMAEPSAAVVDCYDPEKLKGLIDAIAADCAEGNMAQSWAFNTKKEVVYYLNFHYNGQVNGRSLVDLQIRPDAKNSIAYIEGFLFTKPEYSQSQT